MSQVVAERTRTGVRVCPRFGPAARETKNRHILTDVEEAVWGDLLLARTRAEDAVTKFEESLVKK